MTSHLCILSSHFAYGNEANVSERTRWGSRGGGRDGQWFRVNRGNVVGMGMGKARHFGLCNTCHVEVAYRQALSETNLMLSLCCYLKNSNQCSNDNMVSIK